MTPAVVLCPLTVTAPEYVFCALWRLSQPGPTVSVPEPETSPFTLNTVLVTPPADPWCVVMLELPPRTSRPFQSALSTSFGHLVLLPQTVVLLLVA